MDNHLPYCGAPPVPDAILGRWNLDPVLIIVLVALALAFEAGVRATERYAPAQPGRRRYFYVGWAIAAVALISPLCALSVALFSARISQHMVLAMLAAPLVACGRPIQAMAALLGAQRPDAAVRTDRPLSGVLSAAAFMTALWVWHSRAPYQATFDSTAVYWLMHATLFFSAVWIWQSLVDGNRTDPLYVLGIGLFSSVQMGLLGALITLSPRAVFTPHFLTTEAWGLTPLQDQQLGGVIMWVPGCTAFLIVAILGLWRALHVQQGHRREIEAGIVYR